jgi:hypothetical protein
MKRNLLLLTVMMFALSSTLLAAETILPFNGTTLDGWKFKGGNENVWKVGRLNADATTFELVPTNPNAANFGGGGQGNAANRPFGARNAPAMINLVPVTGWNQPPRKGVDIYTEQTFGDCTVKLEFLITKGSNSGVYLMGEYEVQIADSFAKPSDKLGQGDMGAIYSAAAPKLNACGVPGTWQKFEIEFVAPKFDAAGNKTANGLFKKIILNGVVVQENVEVKAPTGGGITMKEAAVGPLMLQGDHGPVAFRNIEIIVP